MKEKDNDEEQEEEIINTNPKNIIIENPKSQEENSPLDSLTEINTEFSENIYFSHFYLAQRELDFEPKPSGEVIPYMMSRDFLYSLFEDKKNYKNANNETYQQILGRVKQFMNSNDDNFNKIFLDHFTYYWDVLGKKNAENIIIPVLSKITEDKFGTRIYFLRKLKNFLEFFEQLGEEGIDIIKNNILNIIEQLYRNKLMPEKKFLPKKTSKFHKTLVLDLDETLIHSYFDCPSPRPPDISYDIFLDKKKIHVNSIVRPGAFEFLENMATLYEIVIFTASLSQYANPLVGFVDKKKKCTFRLYREHCCSLSNGFTTSFIKDLRKLDRDMKCLILIDNNPKSYMLNKENGIPIKTWVEDIKLKNFKITINFEIIY